MFTQLKLCARLQKRVALKVNMDLNGLKFCLLCKDKFACLQNPSCARDVNYHCGLGGGLGKVSGVLRGLCNFFIPPHFNSGCNVDRLRKTMTNFGSKWATWIFLFIFGTCQPTPWNNKWQVPYISMAAGGRRALIPEDIRLLFTMFPLLWLGEGDGVDPSVTWEPIAHGHDPRWGFSVLQGSRHAAWSCGNITCMVQRPGHVRAPEARRLGTRHVAHTLPPWPSSNSRWQNCVSILQPPVNNKCWDTAEYTLISTGAWQGVKWSLHSNKILAIHQG